MVEAVGRIDAVPFGQVVLALALAPHRIRSSPGVQEPLGQLEQVVQPGKMDASTAAAEAALTAAACTDAARTAVPATVRRVMTGRSSSVVYAGRFHGKRDSSLVASLAWTSGATSVAGLLSDGSHCWPTEAAKLNRRNRVALTDRQRLPEWQTFSRVPLQSRPHTRPSPCP